MKANQKQILESNRFKPAEYNEKNLINFERKALWMFGVERYSNPISGFKVFAIFCVLVAAYFIFR